jgi:hypothetical protein
MRLTTAWHLLLLLAIFTPGLVFDVQTWKHYLVDANLGTLYLVDANLDIWTVIFAHGLMFDVQTMYYLLMELVFPVITL